MSVYTSRERAAAVSRQFRAQVVMEFCDDEKLLKKLSDSAVLLDQVQKGLNDYLETKRGVFARFYFLSNDDLLSILSESKDVMRARLGVSLWRLHAVDARRLHQTSS